MRINVVNAAPGATFVGAANCKDCHPNTFDKWCKTKHKKAFDSLVHDPKPNTAFDAECITCHTTGFEYNSGMEVCEGNAVPGGKSVRELPRARVAARGRPR